jgi:putative phosphoesterase
MRVALVSDLHASLVALDAALADIQASQVDRIVCLGDIADLGPEPAETVARLRELGIPCIQGNHDTFVETFPGLMDIIGWCESKLSASDAAFLKSLPAQLRIELGPGATLLCVHGSPRSYDEQLLAETPAAELDAWDLDPSVKVVVAGHTHVQLVRRHRGRTFVNVGSVGQPFLSAFDGTKPPTCLRRVEYAIVEWEQGRVNVELRSLPLDWTAFTTSLQRTGFPNPEAWVRFWDGPERS